MRKNATKIIFIIIIILQVITIIYMAKERARWHIDEYFSYGFINDENMYITNRDDFYNNWHDKEYYESYLEIDETEKDNFTPVYENQKKDVHPPFYYLLLRIFSNFNINSVSIWTGIVLNIVLFIISMCLLYLICMKIFNNKKYALLVCFAAGFTMGILQIAILVRMYQLFILNSLLILYWHLCNKDKKDLRIKDMFALLCIVVVGFLTHYYFAILAVGLFISNVILNLKNKNFKLIFKYTLTLVSAVVVSTLIFPAWLEHIFSGYRGNEAFLRFELMTPIIWLKILFRFIVKVLNYDLFNRLLIAIVGILVIFMVSAICLKVKNKQKIFGKIDTNMLYLIIPIIFYLIVIICVLPYIELRYITAIAMYIIIVLIYYLKKFGEIVLGKSNYLFGIILAIFTFITLVNILKIDNGLFMYGEERPAIEEISNTSRGKKLIYIKNGESWEMYNQYFLFLTYDESIVLKYSLEQVESIIEGVENLILEQGLEKENCVLVIDKLLARELVQIGLGDKLHINHIVGEGVMLTLQ